MSSVRRFVYSNRDHGRSLGIIPARPLGTCRMDGTTRTRHSVVAFGMPQSGPQMSSGYRYLATSRDQRCHAHGAQLPQV